MQFPLLDISLSDTAARAVCWTLVHSLWEGLLIAVLAGLIIVCTRRLPARLRYNLLTADLLLFLLMVGATFSYELRQENHQLIAGSGQMTDESFCRRVGEVTAPGGTTPQGTDHYFTTITRTGNLIIQADRYLNTHATAVTLIWLVCLMVQAIRLTGGVYQVNRLRRQRVALPGSYWQHRLIILARGLAIKRKITLLQSALVKMPATIGFFKPVILLPLGVLTDLPSDQIETILLHELAHIRRSDYVANILLHCTEAIFFFNPGFRWIASLIRREREACCDDMVLAATPDGQSYFQALVAFTRLAVEGQLTTEPSYALQLGGGKADVVWRIRRMLNSENKKLQIMEKAILSFGIMAITVFSLIGIKGTASAQTPATKNTAPAAAPANTDTTLLPPAPQPDAKKRVFNSITHHTFRSDSQLKYECIAIDENGDRYEVREDNDRILKFKVNGKLIPRENYGAYADVFQIFEEDKKVHPAPPPPPPPPVPGDASAVTPAPPTPPTPVLHAPPMQPPAPPTPAPSETAPTLAHPMVYTKEPNPYVVKILADLVEYHLLDRADTLSFSLDANNLIVNGTRQPDDTFQKFKVKYILRPDAHFIYSQYYHSNGSGSTCEVNTGR